MRSRFCSTALLLAVCALSAAPPVARASVPASGPAPVSASPPIVAQTVAQGLPRAIAQVPGRATESLHVYLVAQLTVPEAVSRDTAALRQLVMHAALTVAAVLQREQMPLARGAVLVRSSDHDTWNPAGTPSPTPDSASRHASPANPAGRSASSVDSLRTRVDTRVDPLTPLAPALQVGMLRRR